MQPCKYSKYQKCKKCDVVFYNSCKKFLVAHAAFLSLSIRPFKYSPSKFPKVSYSKNIDTAKSSALTWAIKLNSPVKKLTLSQVISLTVSNEELNDKVFYIECKQKVSGDPEKISGVLQSFIDKVSFNGGVVSVYTAPGVVLNMFDVVRV